MRRLLLAVTLIAATVASSAGQEKRLITETDILKFVWIAEAQISPDGKQVAFMRVVVNESEGRLRNQSLWLVPADGVDAPRVLTSGTRDSSPRWSPDGKATRLRAFAEQRRQAATAADLPAGARRRRGAAR